MLLINVFTLEFEQWKPKSGDDPGTEYAILSHRWNEGKEILFADMNANGEDAVRKRNAHLQAKKPTGWAKIEGACKQARCDGIDYIWIDNCCIDKRSSAVESEEINSMYRYYKEAKICYAYLAGLPNHQKDPSFDATFRAHVWFTRGWTLQELIAPNNVEFFTDRYMLNGGISNKDWLRLGNKVDLCDTLSSITGIDADILTQKRDVHSVSVAKRMSWAAKRTTFKIEDRAYSLIGLFNVNMPMIYGEGHKAFIRLQEEIMKESNDESLFAWRNPAAQPDERSGLLAKSPDMFESSGQFFGYYDWEPRDPFYKTNQGLRITLPLRRLLQSTAEIRTKARATLNCPAPGRTDGFAEITLERVTAHDNVDQTKRHEQYVRVELGEIFSQDKAEDRGNLTTLYVRSSAPPPPVYPNHVLQLNKGPEPSSGYRLYATIGAKSASFLRLTSWKWIPEALVSAFTIHKESGRLAAVIVFARPDQTKFTILLGSLSDLGDVGVRIVNGYTEKEYRAWAHEFLVNERWACNEGLQADLGAHSVLVTVDERVVQDTKYLAVSVGIKEHPIPCPDPYGGAMSSTALPERAKSKGQGFGFSLKSAVGSGRR